MSEAKSGSSSLNVLLQALEPQFRRISCAYRIDTTDADDMLQNTLVRFVVKGPAIRDPSAWLSLVFRRECLRFLRRRGRKLEIAVDPGEVASANLPLPDLGPEERMHLTRTLETLPPRHRKIIWWRYALGMSEAEVAGAMGCKAVSAKKAISRALEALRGVYWADSTG